MNEEKIIISGPEEQKEKVKHAFIFDVVSILVSSVVIVAIAFIFFIRTVGVSGSSMYSTLHDGDRILLSAFTEAEQGDIVVTCQPSKVDYIEPTLVKRVIATEGQTIDIDFDNGIVYVDGEALDEPYVYRTSYYENGVEKSGFLREDFNGPITIPEGYIFVMGDNRNGSTDSRDNRIGLIRKDYVLGKALVRVSPFGQFKIG